MREVAAAPAAASAGAARRGTKQDYTYIGNDNRGITITEYIGSDLT